MRVCLGIQFSVRTSARGVGIRTNYKQTSKPLNEDCREGKRHVERVSPTLNTATRTRTYDGGYCSFLEARKPFFKVMLSWAVMGSKTKYRIKERNVAKTFSVKCFRNSFVAATRT